jgi:hypothetical protein
VANKYILLCQHQWHNSTFFDILLGTVQGSILGPYLHAIFVAPLFDLEFFFAFADDTFIPRIVQNQVFLLRNSYLLKIWKQFMGSTLPPLPLQWCKIIIASSKFAFNNFD